MTVREKIIRQSISRIDNQLIKIQEILDFDWLAERNALFEKWNSLSQIQQRKQINTFVAAEKKLHDKMEKHLNSTELIHKKVKLSLELADLKLELYWIEEAKRQRANSYLHIDGLKKH